MNEQFLFVYGTLKRGFVRHSVLQTETYYGTAVTVGGCRLFDCGSYPGLVLSDDGLAIQGEVYSVSDQCLEICDEVEGVAEGLYAREMIAVRSLSDSAERLNAWVYLYRKSTNGLPDCGVEWARQDSAGFDSPQTEI